MAESLITDLRVGTAKFDQDLKKAVQSADKAGNSIIDALNSINDSVKDLPNSFKKFNDELKQVDKNANSAGKGASRFGSAMGSLKGIIGGLGLVALGHQMLSFGKEAYQASQQLDATSRQLVMLTGNTKAAAAEMAFIRAETSRLALDTAEGAQGFVRLANAAKGTVAEGEGVRQVFSAINEITSAMNLSQEKYGTLMQQTTQIMAKGKLQLEDLNIIAEAGVPILQTLARAMGTSQTEVMKGISSGKLGIKELLLAMNQVRKEYGQLAEEAANTIPAKFARGFNTIKTGLADMISGVLASSELRETFDSLFGGVDLASIFPSREQIAKNVDYSIGELKRLLAIVATIFKAIDNIVRETWQKMVGNFMLEWAKITSFMEKIDNRFKGWWNAVMPESMHVGVDKTGESIEKLTKKMEELSSKTLSETLADALDIEHTGDQLKFLDDLNKKLKEKLGVQVEDDKAAQDAITDNQKKEYAEREKARKKHEDNIKKLTGTSDPEEAAKEQKKRDAALRKEIADEQRRLQQFYKTLKNIAAQERDKYWRDLKDLSGGAKEREADRQKVIEEAKKTADEFKESVQESLAGMISDSIKGDLGNIKDMLDNILGFFADFAAQAAAKFAMDKWFDKAVDFMMGKADSTGKRSGGFFSTQIPGASGGVGTIGGMGSLAGAGFAGGQIGSAAGGALGGRTGSIVGGVLGGAAAGAAMGAVLGGGVLSIPAAAVGAIAGAIVGGITSAIQAGVFSKEKKTTIGVDTSITSASDTSRRSPFGVLSMFDEAADSEDVANAALTFIAETDRAIASYLTETQRTVVEQYLQAGIPEGNLVSAEEMDDAIAKAVALRYYHAITAIAGQDVATNVVGSPFGATSGDIGTIQKRANEALQLLKIIEGFKTGPITETAAAIKAINEQFQALIDQATSLGIPTEEIVAEQQRQLAEITTNFNEDVANQILAITDPVAAEWANLEKIQKERLANAEDAGANMVEVERLNALEREELAKRLADSAGEAASAVNSQLIASLEAFKNQSLSGASQSILALKTQFMTLKAEMEAAGMSTAELTAAYQSQATAIRHQAQEQVLGALYAITNPFQAAMLQMGAQVREFQKLVAEGIIPQSVVDQFVSASRMQARFQEAQRIAAGALTPFDQFMGLVDQFTSQSLSDAERQTKQLTDQFNNLRAAMVYLGLDTSQLEASYQQQLQAIKDQEAERKKQEAEQKKAERERLAEQKKAERDRKREEARQRAEQRRQEIAAYKDSRANFLGAARSDAYQQLQALAKSYRELIAEGRRLGQSTKGITNSYKAQAREIRASAYNSVKSAVLGMTDPFKAAMLDMSIQVQEFNKLVKDKIVPKSLVNQFRKLSIGNAAVDRAQSLIGGGPQTTIEGIGQSFEQFILAGNPLSESVQRMRELNDQFRGLHMAAGALRLDSRELMKSYQAQARVIRQEAIKAIDEQLQAQRDQIKSIDSYLAQLKYGEDLPNNLRFDESRKQFFQATYRGDTEEALRLAEVYRGVARERFGGTDAYYTFRNEIQTTLNALREREQKALEAERARLIRQEENQLKQVEIGRSSLSYLQQMRGDTNIVAQGVRALLVVARQQQATNANIERYIKRTMDRIRA